MVQRTAAGSIHLGEQSRAVPHDALEQNLRHLLYGRKPHVYRVIYRIVERSGEVQILHIRHGARNRI